MLLTCKGQASRFCSGFLLSMPISVLCSKRNLVSTWEVVQIAMAREEVAQDFTSIDCGAQADVRYTEISTYIDSFQMQIC